MSMLAERKRKQRWSLNPRGKYWTEDVNKFGQKMLEKMGWTAGKGLGLNENGITECLRVNYKNDSKGMGYADNGEQWTKHETEFSTFLQNLTGDAAEIKKPDVSLEKKSENSRVRVHYHKFTRGKDLSRYSEKDLANIFGRKTLEISVSRDTEEVKPSETNDSDEKRFGVQTIDGGNMADYFKSKLQKIGNSLPSVKEENSKIESELDSYVGFGFSQGNNGLDTDNSKSRDVTNGYSYFHKLQFVQNNNSDKPINAVSDNEKDSKCNVETSEENDRQKNKKKGYVKIDKRLEVIDATEQVTPQKEKKKSKVPCSYEDISTDPKIEPDMKNKQNIININPAQDLDRNSKKKKKKSKTKWFDKEDSEDIAKEKSETKNKSDMELDNPCLEMSQQSIEEEEIIQKVSKKDRNRKKQLSFDNCALNLSEELQENTKKRKRNKLEDNVYENPCLDLSSSLSAVEEESLEDSKKKKKKRNLSGGLTNDAFNASSEDETPKIKKKKTETKNNDSSENTLNDNVDESTSNKKKRVKFDLRTEEEIQKDLEKQEKRAKQERKNKKRTEQVASEQEVKVKRKNKSNIRHQNTKNENETVELKESNESAQEGKKRKWDKKCEESSEETATDNGKIVKEKRQKKKKERQQSIDIDSHENGVDNFACTANTVEQNIEEGIASMTNAIDNYQNELENQMNERKDAAKQDSDVTTEKPNKNLGSINRRDNSRKSLKKLIHGTLKLNFSGANLDKIDGYGVEI